VDGVPRNPHGPVEPRVAGAVYYEPVVD